MSRVLLGIFILPSLAGAAREPDLADFLAAPLTLPILLYQRYASAAKGTECPMEPSCSAFAQESIRRHGPLFGALQTADRLNRCGHDLRKYPLAETRRGPKWLDPVP
jgi:putative component of membrane protein insertase Oxa1/YidC/SpoIIIJ protein YidD